MITCPNCEKWKPLIMESPSWVHTKNPKDTIIEIQVHCCDCSINFWVNAEVGKILKVYDIETGKAYPFSA